MGPDRPVVAGRARAARPALAAGGAAAALLRGVPGKKQSAASATRQSGHLLPGLGLLKHNRFEFGPAMARQLETSTLASADVPLRSGDFY